MIDSLKLIEALNSKLCHDLSGLASAINTTSKIINSPNETIRNKSSLIFDQAIEKLTNKIELVSNVYKFSSTTDDTSMLEIEKLMSKTVDQNVKLKCLYDANLIVDKELSKIILCLYVLANQTIIKGGTIKIEVLKNNKSCTVNVEVTGSLLKKDNENIEILEGKLEQDNLDIQNAHIYYLSYLMKLNNFDITVDVEEDKIRYLACPK